MKSVRFILWSLLVLALLIIGRPVLFLASVWWHDGSAIKVMPAAGQDDASRLNRAKAGEVIAVASDPVAAEHQLRELLQRAIRENRHISISGARHSMGGHTIYPGGIALDMRAFSRLELDEQKRLLIVGAGARWFEVIPFLDQRGYAVAVMQANNDFSVGGSISVNCHGWQNDAPPISSTVESFRIMLSTGNVLHCSREENRELFSLALGGYGLFGIILEVNLRVVPNDFYRAEAHAVVPSDYVSTYHELTRDHYDAGMAYGRISIAPESFFQEASITLLRRRNTGQPVKNTLVEIKPSLLKRVVFRGGVDSEYGKNLRWWLEKHIGETGGAILSRNQVMNEPSDFYLTRDPETTDILHEYFIPADHFSEFVAQARPILLKHRPELLNVTVRNVETDHETFLRYAPEEMFALVMLFHQRRTPDGETAMRNLTQELIDAALACGGRYYLPYRPHATQEQFLRAYPQAPAFFALKQKYDPASVFENQFSLNYRPRDLQEAIDAAKPTIQPYGRQK